MQKQTPPDTATLKNVVGMFPNLPPAEKAARPGSEKAQYSIELVLIEGSEAYKAAVAAQDAAIRSKWPNGAPANLRRAVKDPAAPSATRADGGATRRGEVYEDADGRGKRWFLRAASQFDLPVWVGRDRLAPKLTDVNYSGGIYTTVVKFAPYSSPATGHGVAAYLQLAWRTSAGTVIGGGASLDADALVAGGDIQFDEGEPQLWD
jgi:hypothetical protein